MIISMSYGSHMYRCPLLHTHFPHPQKTNSSLSQCKKSEAVVGVSRIRKRLPMYAPKCISKNFMLRQPLRHFKSAIKTHLALSHPLNQLLFVVIIVLARMRPLHKRLKPGYTRVFGSVRLFDFGNKSDTTVSIWFAPIVAQTV